MITIDRGDLAALVAALAHEHFSYTGQGLAALRAYRLLQHALETDARKIALSPPNHQLTNSPNQRTEP